MIGEAGEAFEGKAIAVVSAEEDALLIGIGTGDCSDVGNEIFVVYK